jgi:hypothetical protein
MLVSRRLILALGAACLSLVLACPTLVPGALAAGPATVTVRVEGATETKLPPTVVTTTTTPVVKDGNPEHGCAGTTAAGALELATHGSWNGTWFEGFGYSVETILGESLPFSSGSFWNYWFDNKPSSVGVCEGEVSSGDSILFFPECFGECPPPPNPLGIEAPAVAEAGQPVTVTVTSYNHESGAPSPASHATVTFGESPTETDSSGHATLTFPRAGEFTVRATAPQAVRTEATVCVHTGNDGNCGTTAPSSPSGGSTTTAPVIAAIPYRGPFALVAKQAGLTEHQVFRRGHGPRLLSGSIVAHSTVTSVSLELRRRYKGRCYAYDGTTERFRRARCGQGSFFKVSTNGLYSYLLPEALKPGRYVLDVQATDAAGNRTTLARGTSRVVFYVR